MARIVILEKEASRPVSVRPARRVLTLGSQDSLRNTWGSLPYNRSRLVLENVMAGHHPGPHLYRRCGGSGLDGVQGSIRLAAAKCDFGRRDLPRLQGTL